MAIWAALVPAIGSLLGGLLQSKGAKSASDTAAAAADRAAAEQAREFDIIQSQNAPYRSVGSQALNALGGIYGYNSALPPPGGAPSGGGYGNYLSAPQAAGPAVPSMTDQYLAPAYAYGGYKTGELLDPMGTNVARLASGDLRARDLLGPLAGVFGGGKPGDTERFNAAGPPPGLGGQRFKPSQVVNLIKQGYSLDQILQQGYLSPLEGAPTDTQDKEIRYLQQSGLSPADIGRLQGRAAPANAQQPISVSAGGVPNYGLQPGASTQTGAGGAPQTAPDYSAFFQSPDYTFRRNEGIRGIENSFSASGGAKSGNALRALADYNSNLAAGEFGNYFNRQALLAGIGQTATGQNAQAGLQTAANVGNALQNAGNLRASGIQGQYDAYGNALAGLGSVFGDYYGRRYGYGG